MAQPYMRPIPTPAELQKYNVNLPNNVEGIRQSLYDFFYSGTNTSTGTQINFFQVPIGQGTGSGGGPKTLEDTNMTNAGLLPTPKLFLVESLHVHFYPNVTYSTTTPGAAQAYVNEVQKIAEKGYLEFFVGSKAYLDEAPIGRFPPSTYSYGFAAGAVQGTGNTTAVTTGAFVSYAVMSGKPYTMEPPIVLIPNQNFVVNLNWPNGQITGLTAGWRLGVVMCGIIYRNSQ